MDTLDLQHGLKAMLMSLIGLIAANLAVQIGRGIWVFLNRHKGPSSDEFRELIKALQVNTQTVQDQKIITMKMALDIRRIYLFLKVIAGDKWPSYKKQVEEIEEVSNH